MELDTGSLVAIASAGLSVVAAISSGVMAQRARKLEHHLEQERSRESKAERTEELLSRYREPLLLAAQSLQQRLHNGIGGGYLENFLFCGDAEEERYARRFTVYTLAEYFGWVEIIRRDLRFLDLGDESRTQTFNAHLQNIGGIFGSSVSEFSQFRVFRGRQKAIGQLMIVNGAAGSDVMTYPEFDLRLENDPEFRRWFEQLLNDVDSFLRFDWTGNFRQVQAQWALIDLIDFLDPGRKHIPDNRDKLVENANANRITYPPG